MISDGIAPIIAATGGGAGASDAAALSSAVRPAVAALPADGAVLPCGSVTSRRALHLAAMREPPQSALYNSLYTFPRILPGEVAPTGKAMSQRELYIDWLKKAVENSIHPGPGGERVTLPDGRSMGQRELFLEALKHDPTLANVYTRLAATLSRSERVTLPDGRSMNSREMVAESKRLERLSALAPKADAPALAAAAGGEIVVAALPPSALASTSAASGGGGGAGTAARSSGGGGAAAARVCAVCAKPSSLKCMRCKAASYCGADCQRAHWKSGHKTACKEQ